MNILISLKINAFILKLESTLLTYMFKFTNNITFGLQTSITNVHPIFLSFLDIDIKRLSQLNKLRKFFKIKDDNNHSDSNTDANSDNSFDSNLDNSIESNNNKISKNDGNVKSSLVKTNLKISNNDL